MYKRRNKLQQFFRNLVRPFRSWKHGWKMGVWRAKQTPWNEYDLFVNLICYQLEIMAKEFEELDITMSSKQDARRMRLAIKLLQLGLNEHYQDKYYDEGVINKDHDIGEDIQWRDGYNSREWLTMDKDGKAIRLAFRIISQELRGWWQ